MQLMFNFAPKKYVELALEQLWTKFLQEKQKSSIDLEQMFDFFLTFLTEYISVYLGAFKTQQKLGINTSKISYRATPIPLAEQNLKEKKTLFEPH